MEDYNGYVIDDETSDHCAIVLTSEYRVLYSTSTKGRARAFIDGLNFKPISQKVKDAKQIHQKQ